MRMPWLLIPLLGLLAGNVLAADAVTTSHPGTEVILYTSSGTPDDNDIVLQFDMREGYNACTIQSATGAMDVFISVDGSYFATTAYALIDKGATDSSEVAVTAAGRSYVLRGLFKSVIIRQNSGTDVTQASAICGVI